jgi:hypothetical protein
MDFMIAYFVHVVLHLAQVIGGILKNILAQLFYYKLTVGLLIQEINIHRKGFNN